MKKFDVDIYTRSRIRQLRGENPLPNDDLPDPDIQRYTRRRMRELEVQEEMRQCNINLDNPALMGYTVATMNTLEK